MSGSYITSLITPMRVAALTATLSSTAYLFGNLSCSIFGPVPYLLQFSPVTAGSSSDKPGKASLLPVQRAQLWAFFYKGAMPLMVTLLGTSVVAFSTSAYLFSQLRTASSFSEQRSRMGLVAGIVGALASAFVPPFTVTQLGPINKTLLSIAAEQPGSEVHARYVDKLLVKWRGLHVYREVAGAVMVACASTLLLLQ